MPGRLSASIKVLFIPVSGLLVKVLVVGFPSVAVRGCAARAGYFADCSMRVNFR